MARVQAGTYIHSSTLKQDNLGISCLYIPIQRVTISLVKALKSYDPLQVKGHPRLALIKELTGISNISGEE